MKHAIDQEEIMAYLDGESNGTVVSAHLEDCAECRQLADDLRGVSSALTNWQVEPVSEELPDALTAALREQRRSKPELRKHRRWWAWGLAGVGALALLVSVPTSVVRQRQVETMGLRQSVAPLQQDEPSPAPPPAMTPPTIATPAPAAPMIARTANLTLATKEFDRARAGLEDILKRHGGYLGELHTSTVADSGRSLEAALRVPGKELEAVMAEVKRLGRVEFESQQGEEVTQQYTDLQARLDNARNTEKRLTALLAERTGKLADVLQVEQEIDRVRGEIERMEAERKVLAGRVEFATLNVKLEEEYKAQLQPTSGGRFRNAAVEGFRRMLDGLTGVALFLLSAGPTLLLWGAILFFPVRFAWRKLSAWRARTAR
jgi:hypothetical protein